MSSISESFTKLISLLTFNLKIYIFQIVKKNLSINFIPNIEQ